MKSHVGGSDIQHIPVTMGGGGFECRVWLTAAMAARTDLRWTQPASEMRAPKRSRTRRRVSGEMARRARSVKERPSRCSSVSAVSPATVAIAMSPTPAARHHPTQDITETAVGSVHCAATQDASGADVA